MKTPENPNNSENGDLAVTTVFSGGLSQMEAEEYAREALIWHNREIELLTGELQHFVRENTSFRVFISREILG